MALLDKIRSANTGDDIEGEFSGELPGEMLPDPPPGKPARSGRSATPKPAPKRVSPTVKKQLTDEIEAYLLLGAGAWSMKDPYCGEAAEKQAHEIALRLAAILGKNAQIVQWLHTTGVIGEWVALAMAIKPIIDAVRDHHVTKKVQTDGSDQFDASPYPAYRPGP